MTLYYTRRQLTFPGYSKIPANKLVNKKNLPPEAMEELLRSGAIVELKKRISEVAAKGMLHEAGETKDPKAKHKPEEDASADEPDDDHAGHQKKKAPVHKVRVRR